MTKTTRRCADCKADISNRGVRAVRCAPCQAAHAKKPIKLVPRTCGHCGDEYTPRGALQKWCKACVTDHGDRYRINRYGSLVQTEVQIALAKGVRTSVCRTCGEQFTYKYIGGTARIYCDDHVPQRLVAERAKLAAKRKTCAECGQETLYVDDAGRCPRHLPDAKVNRDCGTCGKTFVMRTNYPRRFCSQRCSYTRRGPLDVPRNCELCDSAFYATHPSQKYCSECVETKSDRHALERYGISRRQVNALKAKFDGLCWLCREVQGACVDHCHATEKVRGWLCHTCNKALHYVERPGWWEAARAYLNG